MDCLLVRVNNRLSRTSGQALFRTLRCINVVYCTGIHVYIGPYNRVAYVVCIYACLRILHQFNVLLEISVALVPCVLAAMPSNNL